MKLDNDDKAIDDVARVFAGSTFLAPVCGAEGDAFLLTFVLDDVTALVHIRGCALLVWAPGSAWPGR